MTDYLQQSWDALTEGLPAERQVHLQELLALYRQPHRHYHNLKHVERLLRLEQEHHQLLQAPKTVRLAIWYHDAVYNTFKGDNEVKSADLALRRLAELKVNPAVIDYCCQLIKATKTHELPDDMANDFDAQFFMDIDLAVLGAEAAEYDAYTKNIRKEYRFYPGFMYRQGRKKALKQLLAVRPLYKTELFFDLYERQARSNMQRELGQLG